MKFQKVMIANLDNCNTQGSANKLCRTIIASTNHKII